MNPRKIEASWNRMSWQASGMMTDIICLGNEASGIGNESPKDQNTSESNESGSLRNKDEQQPAPGME